MHTIVQSELLNFNSAKVKLSFTYLTNIYWAPVLSAENRATNNAHEGPALVESATQCISIFPFFICFDKAKWTLTEPKFTDNYFNAKHCSEHRGYSAKTGSLPSRRLRCWIKWMYSFLPTQRWILKGQPNQTFIKQTDEGGKKPTRTCQAEEKTTKALKNKDILRNARIYICLELSLVGVSKL